MPACLLHVQVAGTRPTVDRVVTKDRLRKAALADRDALTGDVRIEKALAAADLAADLSFLDLDPGTVVAGFLPIRSEIDARPVMEMLRQRGCRLCLPAVVDDALEFRELTRTTELIDAGFGTVAPGPDAPVLTPQVLIVPCAAFDRRGHRLGYGAGFYDRALTVLEAPVAVALAFAEQEVDAVPAEPHDVAVTAVLTDREVIVP